MALQAKPNKAHFALAELARKRKDFITLSQNVDGITDILPGAHSDEVPLSRKPRAKSTSWSSNFTASAHTRLSL